MSLVVAFMGALAVNRLHAAATVSVTNEARDVARVVGLLLTASSNRLSESAQKIVIRLSQIQGQDVVVLDSNQTVVADTVPSEVGKHFSENPNRRFSNG